MAVTFWFKLSEMFSIALYSVHTQPGEAVMNLLLFTWSSTFVHEYRKRPKMRHFRR